MGERTGIEWCDATWNPVRGCTRVSTGCTRCYAERVAARFSGPGQPYEGLAAMTKAGPRWTGQVRLVPEHLQDPLRWRKPRRIFVNSMSDLFHERLPFEAIDRVFAVMALATQHTFMVLTKRPKRMAEWARNVDRENLQWLAAQLLGASHYGEQCRWPLPNVWLGVSAEDQDTADQRIPELLRIPAAVRFISAEPLLGPVDLSRWLTCACEEYWPGQGHPEDCPTQRLHMVICGGESGPGARPMHPDWARGLRDQCKAAGVAFFMKQGSQTPEWPAFKTFESFPADLQVREFPGEPK